MTYRYQFSPTVEMDEVKSSLLLAIWGTESLYGEAWTRLEIQYDLDVERRTCAIDAETDVGKDMNKLFTGFLQREFGPDSFRVERLETPQAE